MKILLVINPISGDIDKEPFLEKAAEFSAKYGYEYRVFKTTGKNDHEKLKDLADSFSPDRVMAAGGDGTLLLAATALIDTKIPVGIIPFGSANGMANELKVAEEPLQALKDNVMSQVIHGLDLIRVNQEHYMIHMGDVGVNANIVEAYEKDEKRGMVTYARYFINELKDPEHFKVRITNQTQEKEEECIMLGICNARKYGTGIPLNVQGNPFDGKFELVLIERFDLNTLIKAGLSRFNEEFHDSQVSKVISTEQAIIEFNEPALLQLDGEVTGKFDSLELEIIPGAIPFITHKENPYINGQQD